MTDDKRFPPPLPPRPIVPEPFLKVEDELPAPSFRMRSTPPSGSLLLNREVEQLSEDPRDQMIRDLRLTNILYREKLTAASMPNTAPSPVPEPPKSRAAVAAQVAGKFGKWTTIVMGVLGLAATVAHQFRPDLEGPIQFLLKLLGAP